jgi:hypothetical protein
VSLSESLKSAAKELATLTGRYVRQLQQERARKKADEERAGTFDLHVEFSVNLKSPSWGSGFKTIRETWRIKAVTENQARERAAEKHSMNRSYSLGSYVKWEVSEQLEIKSVDVVVPTKPLPSATARPKDDW